MSNADNLNLLKSLRQITEGCQLSNKTSKVNSPDYTKKGATASTGLNIDTKYIRDLSKEQADGKKYDITGQKGKEGVETDVEHKIKSVKAPRVKMKKSSPAKLLGKSKSESLILSLDDINETDDEDEFNGDESSDSDVDIDDAASYEEGLDINAGPDNEQVDRMKEVFDSLDEEGQFALASIVNFIANKNVSSETIKAFAEMVEDQLATDSENSEVDEFGEEDEIDEEPSDEEPSDEESSDEESEKYESYNSPLRRSFFGFGGNSSAFDMLNPKRI